MRKYAAIVSESYLSHYSDSAKMKVSLLRNFAVNAIVSISYIGIVGEISEAVLTALVAFLSIIVGFSYSVMIFVSSNPFVRVFDPSDREEKLRAKRLNRLVEKLYRNLHFFCIFSLTAILISVLGIGFGGKTRIFVEFFDGGIVIPSYLKMMTNFFFVFFVSELIAEFVRILDRTNYLFSDRVRQTRE